MTYKIVLESNDIDIGEVTSVHVSKTNIGYFILFKDIIFYKNEFIKIKKSLFLRRVGSYSYISQIEVIDSALFYLNKNNIAVLASNDSNLNVNYLNYYSYIMYMWNNRENINWTNLSYSRKKIWLQACSDYSLKKTIKIQSNIVVNCHNIKDIPSLYCCLGEAFLGEKGYIGSNLDALDDCLIDIKHKNISILFNNSNQLIQALNTPKNKEKYKDDYISILLDIFTKHGFICQLL